MNDDVTQNLTVPIQNSFHASEVDSREVVGSLPSWDLLQPHSRMK